MFLSRLGHVQQYFGLVVWLRLRHPAFVWRQALQDSVEVSALPRLVTGQLQWVQLLHCSLQIALACSKLHSSHDPVTSRNQLFHYLKLPLISVFVVVFDNAHIFLLNSTKEVFIFHGVTFSQPTKVLFRPAVPNHIFSFSQVFRSPSKLWVLFIVYLHLR